MNPVTVIIFDCKENSVVTRFLDNMCITSSSTSHSIFQAINSRLSELLGSSNPWNICTSVGVDNTSVNIGVRHSLEIRVLEQNSSVYFSGCPCHIIHNAVRKASDVFCSSCGFDVEEFCLDIYYWFDKSTKRKNSLLSYYTYCDQEYRNIIKHVTTRWLSLKFAIERILKQYPSLKSYFLSENERQPRFRRLHDLFADPMIVIFLECHSLLYKIQRILTKRRTSHSCVATPVIHPTQENIGKVCGPIVLSRHIKSNTLPSLECSCDSNQVDDNKLCIDFTTKQAITRLHEDGSISDTMFIKEQGSS